MLRATFVCLLSLALVPVIALQVPLRSHSNWQLEKQLEPILSDEDLIEWSLDQSPNSDDTDHLVFETVYSFLQHWPNTRMRSGHNIVPGIIPKGTLLYHGRNDEEIPSRPNWVSTDPEHSYLFCRDGMRLQHSEQAQGCWHLTLAALRDLKIVYFDGSSAAKVPDGSLDTQDLLAWGKTSSEELFDEWDRIEALCEWGKDFGVDGFVRMEMDFEAMLCNFNTGVSIVSFLNLVNRRSLLPPMPPAISFEVMNSGSWHNRFPGETRVRLDLAGLVSFYDTQLVPSLVAARAGQERWDHRVRGVSDEDFSAVKSRLEATLTRPMGHTSGFDWKTLVQVIVDRFAGRLELTRHLLNSSVSDPDELLDLANKTQTQLRVMLTPYIFVDAVPTDPSDPTDLDWTRPLFKLCSVTHTYFMESHLLSMTDSEKLIFQAVRGTSREICRVVTRMWAAGVYAGIDASLNTQETLDVAKVIRVWYTWVEELNRLMTWLDWGVWVTCNPACGFEEMCFLPTWPVGFPRWRRRGPHPERLSSFGSRSLVDSLVEEVSNTDEPESNDWVRPQPRCVPRIAPYEP